MAKEKILVVEDEDDIRELVKYNLEKDGYRVIGAPTGEAGIKKAMSDKPDLVVLDLMLPGTDGLSVCKELRANAATRSVPIVMLTARSEEIDVVTGLEVGADDYVTKPFSPRVLLARVRAVLRRRKESGESRPDDGGKTIKRGEIEIDQARHKVTLKGKDADLTHTEFELLRFLAAHPGMVYSRYQLVDAVHGADYPATDRSVDVQIVGLRKKLKPFDDCIETIRGVGYRFSETYR